MMGNFIQESCDPSRGVPRPPYFDHQNNHSWSQVGGSKTDHVMYEWPLNLNSVSDFWPVNSDQSREGKRKCVDLKQDFPNTVVRNTVVTKQISAGKIHVL